MLEAIAEMTNEELFIQRLADKNEIDILKNNFFSEHIEESNWFDSLM